MSVEKQRFPSKRSSRRVAQRVLLVIGIFVVISACDFGGSESSPGSVAGDWHVTIETDSVAYQLAFTLELPDDDVMGNRVVGEGTLEGENAVWTCQIPNGTFVESTRALTLTLRFDESPWPIYLTGTVAEDYREISAQLTGGPPRFESRSVTVTRP